MKNLLKSIIVLFALVSFSNSGFSKADENQEPKDETPVEAINKVLSSVQNLKKGIETGKYKEAKACYYIATLGLQSFTVITATFFHPNYENLTDDVKKLLDDHSALTMRLEDSPKGFCGIKDEKVPDLLPEGDVPALVARLGGIEQVYLDWKASLERVFPN